MQLLLVGEDKSSIIKYCWMTWMEIINDKFCCITWLQLISEHNVPNPTENQYNRWIKSAAFPCSLPCLHPSLDHRAFYSTWMKLIRIAHLTPHMILASDEGLIWVLFTKQCVKYVLNRNRNAKTQSVTKILNYW